MRSTHAKQLIIAVTLLSVALGACASPTGGPTTPGGGGTQPAGEPTEVGMSFEREGDPMVSWMIDSGLVAEMEKKYNVRFVPTETPDDFAFFAGGHGNVIQLGTYEVPLIQLETGIETVTFGRLRSQSTTWLTKADNPANTFADLKGQTLAVNGPGGSQIVWQLLVKEMHGLDYRFDGGDFEVYTTGGDLIGQDLLLRGEVAANACNYTTCAESLAKGEAKVMYDGRTAGQIFTEEIMGGAVAGSANLWHNTLVARKDWYDSHPNEVAFVLEMFQRAADAWNANAAEILTKYATELGLDVESDAAVMEFLTTTALEFDPVLDNVYLTEDAVKAERLVVEKLQQTGVIPADFPGLEYGIVEPPCDTAPDLTVCG